MHKAIGMRRHFYGIWLLLLITLPASAQKPESSLLWEVSGNGLAESSHIFGTFHMMCREDFDFSETLKSTLRKSKQFYGEINMEDLSAQRGLLMKMMSSKPLQSLMTEAEFKQTGDAFQKITGMPLLGYSNFKPFMCTSMLALQAIGCSDKVQPETEFTNIAKQNKLPIKGLETIEDQMNAIDKQPLDSQVAEFKKIVLNFDSVKTMMSGLLAVYKQKNVEALYRFMKSTGASDDFETELLDKRNEKWVPVMKKAMAEKASFFAVGAGHLGGEEGVISLLRKQGYTVKPVIY